MMNVIFCEAHCFYGFAATEKWAPQVAPEKEGRQHIDFNHKNSRCKKCPWQVSCLVWLVVLTILKNISQWEGLSRILWTIKNV